MSASKGLTPIGRKGSSMLTKAEWRTISEALLLAQRELLTLAKLQEVKAVPMGSKLAELASQCADLRVKIRGNV